MTGMSETLHTVRLTVNDAVHEITVPARRLLSDALRHDLRLTGTHVGCEHGVCGACTVLVDGQPVRSCLVLAVSAVDTAITTVEGLGEPDGSLGPVQQAFKDCHGLQCGFCTPGFLTTVTAGLEENPEPTREEAREMIAGNLCRCTGYQNIVSAVCRAAELKRAPAVEEGDEGAGLETPGGFEARSARTSTTEARSARTSTTEARSARTSTTEARSARTSTTEGVGA